MKPKRIQRKRTKGWKMPANTVYVGRGSKWGNPFIVHTKLEGPFGNSQLTRESAVELYRDVVDGYGSLPFISFEVDQAVAKLRKLNLLELKGKNLACWCPFDKPCHVDVLLEIANRSEEK